MKYLLFLLPLLLVGCAQLETDAKEPPSEYWLSNVQEVYSKGEVIVIRTENKEAICYIHD